MTEEKKKGTNGKGEDAEFHIGAEALQEKPVTVKVIDRRFWVKKYKDPNDIEADDSAIQDVSLKPSYVEELEKKYEDAMGRLQTLSDAYKRMRDEQDRLRERLTKQKDHQIFEFKRSFFNKTLEIVDNFERALDAAMSNDKDNPILIGLKMILNQFERLLEQEGVKRLEPLGEVFNPNTAEVVEVIEVNEPEKDHIILEVVQPGYQLGDFLLRPARVKVGQYAGMTEHTSTSQDQPQDDSNSQSSSEHSK